MAPSEREQHEGHTAPAAPGRASLPADALLALLDTPVALLGADGTVLASSASWVSSSIDLRHVRRWVLDVTSGGRDWVEVPLTEPDGATVRISQLHMDPPVAAFVEVVSRTSMESPALALFQAVRDVEGEVVDLHVKEINDAGARWVRTGATPDQLVGSSLGGMWPQAARSPFVAVFREALASEIRVHRPLINAIQSDGEAANIVVEAIPVDGETVAAMWRTAEVGRPPARMHPTATVGLARLQDQAATLPTHQLEVEAVRVVGESLRATAAAVLSISPDGTSEVRAAWNWDDTVEATTVAAEAGSWMSAMIHSERADTRLLVVCADEPGQFDQAAAELVHAAATLLAEHAPEPVATSAPTPAATSPGDAPRHAAGHDDTFRGRLCEVLAGALEELADRRAERKGRHGGRVGLLDVDLHELPLLSTGLIREEADKLVEAAVAVIRDTAGPGCHVTPVHDDRVWVVVPQAPRAVDVLDVADRVVAAMERPLPLSGREVSAPVSVGVALARLGDERPSELLDRAEAALTLAKQRGPSSIQLYTDEVGDQAQQRLTTAKELRSAGANNELILHWQPVIDLATDRAVGAEALLRWQHPIRGLLSPREFLPVAESSGQLPAIGRFVMEAACRQLRRWLDDGTVDDEFVISFNLASHHLTRPELPETLERILQNTRLRAKQVCIEVTESAVLSELDQSIDNALRLRELGVDLAIDDFGTGYSSLAQLRRLPVRTVKLDRAFLADLDSDPTSASLVDGVIRLAQGLGLKVIAEGAERGEQVDILIKSGCHQAQGYWWTPPVAADALTTWLLDRTAVDISDSA